jgi:hypothetical protein
MGAIVATCKWNQATSADSYVDLIQSAALGEALSTPFQLQLFLNLLGVNAPAYGQAFPLAQDFRACDEAHQQVTVVKVMSDLWREIGNTLAGNETFESVFDVLNLVRDNLSAKLRVRTRPGIVLSVLLLRPAPSTHEWVHGFALRTGISPPLQASETDAIAVRCPRPCKAKEDFREFLHRQKDRRDCAWTRGSRHSGRNSSARRPPNRYSIGRRDLGRGAFRRSWANCQDARY